LEKSILALLRSAKEAVTITPVRTKEEKHGQLSKQKIEKLKHENGLK